MNSRIPILVALLLVLAGCGDVNGPEETGAGEQTVEVAPAVDETDDDELAEIVYQCGEVSLPLDQLLTLDSVPDSEADDLAAVGGEQDLGRPDQWGKLASSLLIKRQPLDTKPPGLLIASEGAGVDACIAIRSGDGRPVAWRVESIETAAAADTTDEAANGPELTAAIESCVSAEEVTTDVQLVNGDAVIALSLASPAVATNDSCIVDGSNLLQVSLPAGFDGDVLAAQTWPFIAPDPEAWVTSNNAALVAPLAEGALDDATCLAVSGLDGVGIQWWNVPGGTELEIVADGEPLSSAGLATGVRRIDEELAVFDSGAEIEDVDEVGPDGVFSLFGAPPEPGSFYELHLVSPDLTETIPCGNAGTLTELPTSTCTISLSGGFPQLTFGSNDQTRPLTPRVSRDGEVIDVDFIDSQTIIDRAAEPGRTHTYELELQDDRSDRAPITTPCGSIAVPEPGDEAEELTQAKELFDRSALGAHAYLTLVIDGENRDLYMQPDLDGGRSFNPPLDETDYVDPFTLHEELIEAIEGGSTVAFEIDSGTGAPISWEVDSIARELLCLELDTAPPALRGGGCDPTLDLLGR